MNENYANSLHLQELILVSACPITTNKVTFLRSVCAKFGIPLGLQYLCATFMEKASYLTNERERET